MLLFSTDAGFHIAGDGKVSADVVFFFSLAFPIMYGRRYDCIYLPSPHRPVSLPTRSQFGIFQVLLPRIFPSCFRLFSLPFPWYFLFLALSSVCNCFSCLFIYFLMCLICIMHLLWNVYHGSISLSNVPTPFICIHLRL